MSKSRIVIFLGFILLIAAIFRFYRLSDIPPGINRDEGSIGYTAYSLIKTGADEYGRGFPISFQSFGDWKLPLYIYSVVPFVSMLGLSELAVRLPSALFGLGSVFLIFFLTKAMFKDTKMALLTSLLLALEPWSIHLSRVESESNTAVFLSIAALLFFFHGIQKKKAWAFIPSSLLFALTYFTYAGNYVFTTLFVAGIIFIYRNVIPKKKETWAATLIFAILFLFISYQTMFANQTKLSGISIFGDPAVVHAQIEIPRTEHQNPNAFIVRLLYNRFEFGAERFAQNYLNSFDPQFLFIAGGDNHAHNIENFGNMYIVEALFFYLGIAIILFRLKGKEKQLLLWWLLIGPIAASITKDAPHTNRMAAILPVLPLTTSFGLQQVADFASSVKIKNFRFVILLFIGLLYLFNVFLYIDRYFYMFPRNEAENWGLGYKELSQFLLQPQYSTAHVIITQPQTSPYIFLLFYQKYDPKKYQEQAVRYPPTDDGFVHVKGFGRYEFRDITWNTDLNNGNILIDDPSDIPQDVKDKYTIGSIVLPDGSTQFQIIQKK